MTATVTRPMLRADIAHCWQFQVARERAAIGRLADDLEHCLAAVEIEASRRQALATVLDELLANVLMHATGAEGDIAVRVLAGAQELIAHIRYSADAFDPTRLRAAEHPTSVAAAGIGGVGIAMVKAMTTGFSHSYRNGKNHLCVRLALTP